MARAKYNCKKISLEGATYKFLPKRKHAVGYCSYHKFVEFKTDKFICLVHEKRTSNIILKKQLVEISVNEGA